MATIEIIKEGIEIAALVIELAAVSVIVAAVLMLAVRHGTIRYVFQSHSTEEYEQYKHQLGKALLLGLELLVAADVVRTVALQPTLANVLILGLLVVIRTLLSWSLTVEMKGRWPWQDQKAEKESRTSASE